MEPNDAASSSARAQELRASLGTRREVEALLAEASATREAAVADADAIIEEAQQVSEQLLRESRSEADRLATDARLRAEGVVSRARTEAEDITRQGRAAADAVRARAEAQVEEHRRRVRAELTEQVTREVTDASRRELARVQERQQAMIGDLEASVRILGVSMEAAVANIAEMLGALDSLRTHTAESLGDAAVPMTTPPRHAEPLDHLIRSTTVATSPEGADSGPDADDVHDGEDGEDGEGDEGGKGSIFDNPGPGSSVPPAGPVYDVSDVSDDQPEEQPDNRIGEVDQDELDALDELAGDEEPLTATEAFLRSAHIDHGDPPLPPMDDADVGARYARDAMRATARARTRRDEETLEVLPASPPRNTRNGNGNAKADHDERVAVEGEADADPGDDSDTSGKPLGWLFRSSS